MVIFGVEHIARSIIEHKHKRQRFEKSVNVGADHRGADGIGYCAVDPRANVRFPQNLHNLGVDEERPGNPNRTAESDFGRSISHIVYLHYGPRHRNHKSRRH